MMIILVLDNPWLCHSQHISVSGSFLPGFGPVDLTGRSVAVVGES